MVTQAETKPTPTLTKIKEWLTLAAATATVAGIIIGGMFGAIKLANAPLQTDIQAIHGRLDRMQDETKAVREEINGVRKEIGDVRGEIADVREDMAAFGERLIRVETLLEQMINQAPEPPATKTE